MAWDWLDLPNIKIFSQHTSATLAAMVSFWLVNCVAKWMGLPNPARGIIEGMEQFALIGTVGWLFFQGALILWKGRVRNYVVFVVA